MSQHSYTSPSCRFVSYSSFKSILIFLFFTSVQVSGFAQIEFSLNLLPDSSAWGVYARPDATINPSTTLQLASAQATLVISVGDTIGAITPVNGIWAFNARVNSPIENPNFNYLSIGYHSGFPTDAISSGSATLLFLVEKLSTCPDSMALMDHGDPFARPNSLSTNPENDFSAFDAGNSDIYGWSNNFGRCAWSCEPCAVESGTSNTEKIETSPISVHPNPTNGIINFKNEKQDVQSITVRNLYGQTVFQESQPSQQINLSHLSSGSYFIFFENEKAITQTKRIIIQK